MSDTDFFVDERGLRSLSDAVLDSAPDAVVSVEDRGRVVIFNAAAQRLFGIEH
jgi:PAS domain-containing protein